MSALEVDEDISGIETIPGRYRAYQFFMYANEIKASEVTRLEFVSELLRDEEFLFTANIRHDKSTQSSLVSLQTTSGKNKFVIWIDSKAGKIGIKTNSILTGKKHVVFKRLPIKQGQWHKVVLAFKNFKPKEKPEITLHIDCQEIEKKIFPSSLKESIIEDSFSTEIRLGQSKNLVNRNPHKFIVSK